MNNTVRALIGLIYLILAFAIPATAAAQESLARSEAFKDIKVLNNLCWELFNRQDSVGLVEPMQITLPIDRWVFIRSQTEMGEGHHELRITIDSDPLPVLVHTRSGVLEAMRYMKAGTYTLYVKKRGDSKLTNIVVRAIPELQHALYGESCHIYPYGPYDWEFLKKHVLPNVNLIISNRHMAPKPEEIGAWKTAGRGWIDDASAAWHLMDRSDGRNMRFKGDPQDAADAIYDYWASNTWALRHPLVDGLIIDEIVSGNIPVYDDFRGAAAKLYAHQKFSGKRFDLYVAGPMLYENERGKALARFCVDHGGMIADEWYLQEIPTLQGAWDEINKRFAPKMRKWEASMPGVTPHIVAALANETAYPENSDRYPHVDFKVFMDMQMHTLATQGEFFALGGIQWYKSGYADEEVLRFGGRLFRHYCIEGNTEPISNDPYELNHIANPDFEAGTEGWQIQSAVPDSVRGESYAGYGRLQGRWGDGMGDKFLWTRRSADQPNVFVQEIKGLEPGRLYSLKMISSDYQDLVAGKSAKQANAVSIELTNVDIMTAPDKSFQFTYRHSFGDKRDKFEASTPYWMNLHRLIFRANASTSKLTVRDWQSDNDPGGPAGQELMFNFIQIQPYLE